MLYVFESFEILVSNFNFGRISFRMFVVQFVLSIFWPTYLNFTIFSECKDETFKMLNGRKIPCLLKCPETYAVEPQKPQRNGNSLRRRWKSLDKTELIEDDDELQATTQKHFVCVPKPESNVLFVVAVCFVIILIFCLICLRVRKRESAFQYQSLKSDKVMVVNLPHLSENDDSDSS